MIASRKAIKFRNLRRRRQYLISHGMNQDSTEEQLQDSIVIGNAVNQRMKQLLILGAEKLIKWHVGIRFNGYGANKRRCTCQGNPVIGQVHIISCEEFNGMIAEAIRTSNLEDPIDKIQGILF